MGIENKKINSINDTVDYGLLLQIIQQKFSTPTPLLETLIQEIEKEILLQINSIKYLYLSIQKNNPPLQAVVKSSEVSLERNY